MSHSPQDHQVDQATARRLRRLSTMPVDTSGLDKAIGQAIPKPVAARSSRSAWRAVWPGRSVAAAALSFVVMSLVLLVVFNARPALAEPASMAELHRDLVSGTLPMTRVSSITEANQLLSKDWPSAPEIPTLPADHQMACCMKNVAGKRVACVVLEDGGVPISVVVAPKGELRAPEHAMMHSAGKVNMLMQERDGRWYCIMGEVSADRLQQIASEMKF